MTAHPLKHSKRQDLQGIRGIAIISVLGFHFYPSIFPNGYFGVDQFFVLSGYLMYMLLERLDSQPIFSSVLLFYAKRFKRILPLYFLILIYSLVCLYLFFPETALETNLISASKALIFTSNRPKTDQENYFSMLKVGIDVFTHTWSLSVEVQFYVMVPFLFFVGKLFNNELQIVYYVFIGSSSFLYYSISFPDVSFNSVYSRVWQFVVGIIVYSVTHPSSENGTKFEKIDEMEVSGGTEESEDLLVVGASDDSEVVTLERIADVHSNHGKLSVDGKWLHSFGRVSQGKSSVRTHDRKISRLMKLGNIFEVEKTIYTKYFHSYRIHFMPPMYYSQTMNELIHTEISMYTSIYSTPTEFAPIVSSFHFLKYFLLISMSFIVIYPCSNPTSLIRPYFTIASGLLMLVSHNDPILTNPVLTYIGDISYSLYLIHWPIYSYWKLTMEEEDQVALFLCLIVSVLSACVIYETYEKWYLSLPSTTVGFLVVFLFISNLFLINKATVESALGCEDRNSTTFDGITDNMTLQDAAKMNSKWAAEDGMHLRSETCDYENLSGSLGWCRHKGLDPKSKYKIMTIGNSWTANHANMFYQECHHKANSILQGSAGVCEPLYPTTLSEACKKNFTDFAERIEKFKPDYAFLIARFFAVGEPISENIPSLDDDPIYQTMKTQLSTFVKNVKKKLFILDAIPSLRNIPHLVRLIEKGLPFEQIDKYLVDLTFYDTARRRYAKLLEDCGDKCVRIDYVPEFFNKSTKTFRYYDDRGFTYFTYANHLTPHGLEHVRHLYTDICKKL